MNIREWFEYANSHNVLPEQFHQFMVNHVQKVVVLYQKVNEEIPFFAKGNHAKSKFVVAFTDVDAARQVKVEQPEYVKMVEESTIGFLIKSLRLQVDGIVFNPGLPSRYFVMKQYLKDLIKEYLVMKLSQLPGPWIPTQGQHLLCVDANQGSWAVAIYASEQDAKEMCNQSGLHQAAVIQHPWSAVIEWCQRFQIHTPPYLHFGLPEATLLTSQDMDRILRGPQAGYQEFHSVVHDFVAPNPSSSSDPNRHVTPPVQEEPVEQKEKTVPQISKPLPQISQPFAPIDELATTSPEVKKEKVSDQSLPNQQSASNDRRWATNPYRLRNIMTPPGTEIYVGPKQVTIDISDWPINDLSTERDTILPKPANPQNSTLFQTVSEGSSPNTKPNTENDENADLDQDIREGLNQLKRLISDGGGVSSWEVCKVLAKLRKIWVITSQKELVILARENGSPVVDLFTSKESAQHIIDQEKAKKPDLPSLTPQLVETETMYKKFAKRNPVVWINRSNANEYRVALGDPLPFVLQLMNQMR
ncbi:hypothetical protein [Thermoflavimicrobium dichotomicum]|uniref:SseB protein N-terminal domain-containing protein n=1 Tax=Thermoflavimicrobium dichotomicum TaxID=46223 RepID=A0A1I3MKD8_9BACL|nr:hypothetical protein [Thermoflavimicrobium dichotomicum]SFI97392.1 hypothetical protein SAMN05421852_103103 [Thermoflavimicrobium dichotomicum]